MRDGLREFLSKLENSGELVRVKADLRTEYEIAATLRYVDEVHGKAVLCEKVVGYDGCVVGNLFSSRNRVLAALGLDSSVDLAVEFLRRASKLTETVTVGKGRCYEVVEEEVDILETVPALVHHEKDAGPYLTTAVTIARDPETGVRGAGVHRIQVKGPSKVGVFLNTPPLSEFLQKAEARNEDLPIAIVIGVDPVTWLAASAPARLAADKLALAGALCGQPVEVAKCWTVPLEVPYEAEFVLEGRVKAHLREKEGPFGESTGVYLTWESPVAEIDLLAHRKDPIYHALVPFGKEEAVLFGISHAAKYLLELQKIFPSVSAFHLDELDWTRAIVQVRCPPDDEPKAIIRHVFRTSPYVKSVIVVDSDIDPSDPRDVAYALATRLRPERDMVVETGLPGFALDPLAHREQGGWVTGKIGFDATIPFRDDPRYEKVKIPEGIYKRIISALQEPHKEV